MGVPEGGAEQGGEVEIEGGDEDAELARYLPSEPTPSAKDDEEHRCSRIPFRSWCAWCMVGRGLGIQHRAAPSPSFMPTVGLDYFFTASGGTKGKSEMPGTACVNGVDGQASCLIRSLLKNFLIL